MAYLTDQVTFVLKTYNQCTAIFHNGQLMAYCRPDESLKIKLGHLAYDLRNAS